MDADREVRVAFMASPEGFGMGPVMLAQMWLPAHINQHAALEVDNAHPEAGDAVEVSSMSDLICEDVGQFQLCPYPLRGRECSPVSAGRETRSPAAPLPPLALGDVLDE